MASSPTVGGSGAVDHDRGAVLEPALLLDDQLVPRRALTGQHLGDGHGHQAGLDRAGARLPEEPAALGAGDVAAHHEVGRRRQLGERGDTRRVGRDGHRLRPDGGGRGRASARSRSRVRTTAPTSARTTAIAGPRTRAALKSRRRCR